MGLARKTMSVLVGILLVVSLIVIVFIGGEQRVVATPVPPVYRKGIDYDAVCVANCDQEDGRTWDLTYYDSPIRYNNGSELVPIDTTIVESTYLGYDHEAVKGIYHAYFKNDINTGSAVRFGKDGYYFVYDLSGGKMQWTEQEGDVSKTKSISAVQSSTGKVNKNKMNYSGAFLNTDVEYFVYNTMLKETFVLRESPVHESGYLFLEYSGEIKYSDGLTLWVNDTDYTGKSFRTTERIEFRDGLGSTVFYLIKPYAVDSNGDRISLEYDIKVSADKIQFGLKIPYSWLQNAVYPVTIDPTISPQPAGTTGIDAQLTNQTSDYLNYGVTFYSWIGTTNAGGSSRALIRLNWSGMGLETSNVSSIDSLNISLYISSVEGGGGYVSIHQMFTCWDEGTQSGAAGNVSWYANSTEGGRLWGGGVSGTDYNATTNHNISVTASGVFRNWSITPSVADSQFDGTVDDCGFILISNKEDIAGDILVTPYLSDYTTDTTLRPIYFITYTEVTANAGPTWLYNTTNASTITKTGLNVSWGINLSDDSGLDFAYLVVNGTDDLFHNTTLVDLGDVTSIVLNETNVTDFVHLDKVCGRYWFNDTDGESNESGTTCFVVANTLPPSPASITPVSGNQTTNNITLTCAAVTDADAETVYYEIYGDTSATPTTKLQNTSSNTYSWTLTASGVYYYRCRAHDAYDNSASYTSINYRYSDFNPPYFTGNATNGTGARHGEKVNWSITINDDMSLSYYALTVTNNSGTYNLTLTELTSNPQTVTVDYNLTNETGGDLVCAHFWANDTSNLANESNSTNGNIGTCFVVADSASSITGINWFTTGGFSDDSLIYGQVMDWVAATVTDPDVLEQVNITVTADSVKKVDNVAMANDYGDNWNYTTNFDLATAGTWTINITTFDGYTTNSTTTTFVVYTQNVSTKDGWYGYTANNVLSSVNIISNAVYGYDLYEFSDNISTAKDNWDAMLSALNDSNTQNIHVGLNYILDINYNSTSDREFAKKNISATFSDLLLDPYSETVEYISFELVNFSGYSADAINNTLIELAENATGEVGNLFVIYSKSFNDSNLDTAYIQYTTMLYVTETTESAWIDRERALLKFNASLNRVYVLPGTSLQASIKDYQEDIMDRLPGKPKLDGTVGNDSVVELDGSADAVVVFNTGSAYALVNVNTSNVSGTSGKDVWDFTENQLIVKDNSNGSYEVNVSGYSANIILFEDLDHIQMKETLAEASVYKGAVSSVESFNYTNRSTDTFDNSAIDAANEHFVVELHDPHYIENNFFTYYGWLNASKGLNFSKSIPDGTYAVILASQSPEEVALVNWSASDYWCMYQSVAEYTNNPEWYSNMTSDIDTLLALNDSINCIFLNGLDTAVGVANFSSWFKDLVNYIRVDKDKFAILNTYTAYEDFSTWGDAVMKESCVNRWNGSNTTNITAFGREDWQLELNKSVWYKSHGVKVLCQAYNNRTRGTGATFVNSVPPNRMWNGSDNLDVFFAAKVLGYEYFFITEPDNQQAIKQWYPDVGTDLSQSYSTDDNETYYRRYSNGIIYYNSTTGQGWIDDGRTIDYAQVCVMVYDGSGDAGGQDDGDLGADVNPPQNVYTAYIDEYKVVDQGDISSSWSWQCVNLSQQDIDDSGGIYYVVLGIYADPGTAIDSMNLGLDKLEINTLNSWYSTSATSYVWTGYASDQNLMVSIEISENKKTSIDTTAKISQSEVNVSGIKTPHTNVTLSSTRPYDLETWTYPTTVGGDFVNVSVLIGTTFETLNVTNTSTCDNDNPTFNSTTVSDSKVYKACIEQSGSAYIYRFAAPSLSSQVFQIQSEDITYPTWANINNNGSTVVRVSGVVNWTANISDESALSYAWLEENATVTSGGLPVLSNQSITALGDALNYNVSQQVTVAMKRGNYSCGRFWFNDTNNNVNVTDWSCFTVANSPPTMPTIDYPLDYYNYSLTSIGLNVSGSNDADSDTITYYFYINGTLNSTSTTNSSYNATTDGTYSLYVAAYDQTEYSSHSTLTIFSLDTKITSVTLISPANNSESDETTQNFYYNVTDELSVDNCSLYFYDGLTNTKDQTNSSIDKSLSSLTFFKPIMSRSVTYNWWVGCIDSLTNEGFSGNFSIYIKPVTEEPSDGGGGGGGIEALGPLEAKCNIYSDSYKQCYRLGPDNMCVAGCPTGLECNESFRCVEHAITEEPEIILTQPQSWIDNVQYRIGTLFGGLKNFLIPQAPTLYIAEGDLEAEGISATPKTEEKPSVSVQKRVLQKVQSLSTKAKIVLFVFVLLLLYAIFYFHIIERALAHINLLVTWFISIGWVAVAIILFVIILIWLKLRGTI